MKAVRVWGTLCTIVGTLGCGSLLMICEEERGELEEVQCVKIPQGYSHHYLYIRESLSP
jgi:hypothetical protein